MNDNSELIINEYNATINEESNATNDLQLPSDRELVDSKYTPEYVCQLNKLINKLNKIKLN